MYKKDWITRLEYKLGRFAVPNFMAVIVGVMTLVYVLDLVMPAYADATLSSMLSFDRDAIFAGQVWRIITFILVPPSASPVFIIFSLYLYYLYGTALEASGSAFRFNLFYLCGMLGAIAVGFIFGVSTNEYLNLSIFIAFALIYPDFELHLFFVLPVKVKYIAFADMIVYGYFFAIGSWAYRIIIILSFANLIIFFRDSIISNINRFKQNRELKKRFKK